MRCSGIGPSALISEFDKIDDLSDHSLEHLELAARSARKSAQARVASLLESAWAIPAGFPSPEELLEVLGAAAASSSHDLTTHIADAPPDHPTTRSLPFKNPSIQDANQHRLRVAASEGCWTLANAERRFDALADLVDDLQLALAAPVQAWLVSGTCGAAALRSDNRSVVLATGAPVQALINGSELNEVTIGGGGSLTASGLEVVKTRPGSAAIVLQIHMPMVADIARIVTRLGGYVPRMRADVPRDLDRPGSAYAIKDPIDVVQLLNEEVEALFTPAFTGRAFAWWRATLRPSQRSATSLLTLPHDVESWEGVVTVGTLPGGFGFFAPADDGAWLAANGQVFQVPRHLFGLLAALTSNEPHSVDELSSDCPSGDPMCLRRAVEQLLQLGLVRVASHRGA